MTLLTRQICVLAGLQAICLGIGFWFQHRLVVSTTEREAIEHTWSELSKQSGRAVEMIRGQQIADLDWDRLLKFVPVSELDNDSKAPAFVSTNSHGLILGFTDSAAEEGWQIGQLLTWIPDIRSAHEDRQYGRLVTKNGERAGILYTIKNRGRQIVVYPTASTSPSWKASLLSSFPLASVLGFLWTWILSVVASVLLVSRFGHSASPRQTEFDHSALRNAQDLLRTRDAVIFGLAKLAESRDSETGHHLERISLYATRLASALRTIPKYRPIVTPTFVRLLGISSVLHDIGKVGVEDTVLLKPGKLTASERERMQLHTLIAGDCLKEIEQRLGASNFLQTAREIALHHHERWDGTGYPFGLAGENIPLAARIVAIADVYDALNSKRIYKDAFPHAHCVAEIRSGAGSQFDPELVDIFLTIEPEFAEISGRFVRDASQSLMDDVLQMVDAAQQRSDHLAPELFQHAQKEQGTSFVTY